MLDSLPPPKAWPTRGRWVLIAIVAVTALVLTAVELAREQSRQLALKEYSAQQALIANEAANQLDRTAGRLERALSRVQANARQQGIPKTGNAPFVEVFREAMEDLGARGDLLRTQDFALDLGGKHHHSHPVQRNGQVRALPCPICIGEGLVLPIMVPLEPGNPDGKVFHVDIPLSLLTDRIARPDRMDQVWWADENTWQMLAGNSHARLGEDLRTVAGPCLQSFTHAFSGVQGEAQLYCWPQADGENELVRALFAPVHFLGLKTRVGVSVSAERLETRQEQASITSSIAIIIVLLATTTLLWWLMRASRQQLGKERKGALQSLMALGSALDARDHYTRFHSENVGLYAAELGRRMNLPKADVKRLQLAGRMHDIGKIGICDGILNKPGKLTPKERKEIETHTSVGEHILHHLPWASRLAQVAGSHHERMDGGGYPRGIGGEEIPRDARIVAVADVLDALLTDRPYRAGMSLNKALSIIADMSGSHLDPQVVDVLMVEPESIVAKGHGVCAVPIAEEMVESVP